MSEPTKSPPTLHFHEMDISFSHFLHHFPEAPLKIFYKDKKIEMGVQLDSVFKAISTSADNVWKAKIDGVQVVLVYEEVTKWNDTIKREILIRKGLCSKRYNLPPLGVLILPDSLFSEKHGNYTMGVDGLPHTVDENIVINLKDLHKDDIDTSDLGQMMLYLFANDVEIDEAHNIIESIPRLAKNQILLREATGISYLWAGRRFGREAFKKLWSRVEPMVEESPFYIDIIKKGEIKGEIKGKIKGKANTLVYFLEMKYGNDVPLNVKSRINHETNESILDNWFRLIYHSDDIQAFRSEAGL